MKQSKLNRHFIATLAVGVTLGFTGITFAQQADHMQDMKQGANGQAKQEIDQVATKRETEAMQSGGKMVQVPESALFMLSSGPREHFHKAIEALESEPGHVKKHIGMAASLFELQASRADGDTRKQMQECAKNLFALGEKVETRQVLSKEELEKNFAKALHTLATFEQQQARQGLTEKDAARVGYSLQEGNYDLAEALVYSKQNPSPEVSKALFNADTLGEQLIHLAKPTTGQLAARDDKPQDNAQTAGAKQTPEQPTGGATAKQGSEPLNGTNQIEQAKTLPKESEQVVQQLGAAIEQTRQMTAAN